ncbi:C-x8-C-x5-C-x3-H type zinc finger protein-like protein [Xylogone sp. PMI_703]|nr:C-x8-C-x5-C-x3-H type zinc finger protein-like protein [Xylogone sp. PMI_703]
MDAPMNAFFDRYQALQMQRDTTNELIKDMFIFYDGIRKDNARLSKELEDAHLDLDDARKSRRELQLQLNTVNQHITQVTTECESMKNRNPYAVALLDGDGMIFHQDLVRQGLEGGKKAANMLRNVILENFDGITEDTEIIAKVYANISGLAKAMLRDGCIDKAEDLKEFTLGFTQGKASFDFIDVGHGKERADAKIREATRWNLRNYNCKQILLGISHDSGYAPFIDDMARQEDHCPVTIIEGIPTVRELTATGLPVVNVAKNLFRSEKLTDRASSITGPASSTWAGVSSIPTPTLNKPAVISVRSSPTPAKATPVKATPNVVPNWNPGPRGLDPPININAAIAALPELKKKTPNKLCNLWYLRNECKNFNCQFDHDYKPTDEELEALAYLNRCHPCSNGQDCLLDTCIYGHHCPSTTARPGMPPLCIAFGCRFHKDDHPPDTRYKHINSPNPSYSYD